MGDQDVANAELEALRVEVRVLRAELAEREQQHVLAQKRKQRRIDALTEALRSAGIEHT